MGGVTILLIILIQVQAFFPVVLAMKRNNFKANIKDVSTYYFFFHCCSIVCVFIDRIYISFHYILFIFLINSKPRTDEKK